MNLGLHASGRMHAPLPKNALSPVEVLTVAFNPKSLTGGCEKTFLTGRWISSVGIYSFAFQFSTPSSAVTTERLCWSGLMLLEMVQRPITHFIAAAKELSDGGSYGHRSDWKLWPQRSTRVSHPIKSSMSYTAAPMESINFVLVAEPQLHWENKSCRLS